MTEQPSPESIFERVLQYTDADDRTICLDEACSGNEELRREVESLLAAHAAAGSFLEPQVTPEPVTPGEQEGDQIGHYKLLELIGEGGFGRVWMAEQTEPVKRSVALKVIKPGMDSKEVIARFEAERQALALMDHPNIAHVHEAGATESGRPYFVMELVKGIPLTNYCNERTLGTSDRLELFLDVCSAVQHAHQKGIIHRDLKPSNILVSPHDGEPVVKVIDFGIAKAIGMELTDKTLFTALGRMIGTPQYMSPEQAELNALDVDTRSDIYSLGVILYELLTGNTPLDGEKLRSAGYEEMQRMIREEEPKKPSTRISELREHSKSLSKDRESELRALQSATARELDWIVLKALEKERLRRYQTADSFADDLRRYLADEAIEARPPSALYRWRKIARRHRGGITAAAAITITLIAGAATSTYLAVTASQARAAAEREAAISKAVNDFINNDLFPAASPDQEPDRDLKVRTVIDRASASIEGRFPEQPLVEAAIRLTLSDVYWSLAEYSEAQKHAVRCYRLRKNTLGEDEEATLDALDEVATLRGRLGDEAGAVELKEEILGKRRRVLGAEDPATLHSMRSLAHAYQIVGRVSEAMDLAEAALKLSHRVYGPDHVETLRSSEAVATACNQIPDRKDEAIELWEQCLAKRRELFDPAHPDTVATLNNLATAYHLSGQDAKALELLKGFIESYRNVRGPHYPATLRAMDNLAVSYQRSHQRDKVLELATETLALKRKVLGPEHSGTLEAMVNVAAAQQALGHIDEALKVWKETLEMRRQSLGRWHPETVKSLCDLGTVYIQNERSSEGLEHLEEGLELTRKIHGPGHPNMLRPLENLASTYVLLDRRTEARPLFEELLPLQREKLGSEHKDTLNTMEVLGSLYLEASLHDQAIPLFREIYEVHLRTLMPDFHETVTAFQNLYNTSLEAERFDDMATDLARFIEFLRRVEQGPDSGSKLLGHLNENFDWLMDQLVTGSLTEEKIARYYSENPEAFRKDLVRLHTLVLPLGDSAEDQAGARRMAARLREEIAGGGDFEELARMHSRDPYRKEGGDRGDVVRGKFKERLEAVISSMQAGELSEVQEVGSHLWIIRVDEHKEDNIPPIGEVRETIVSVLEGNKRRELRNRLEEEARKDVDDWERKHPEAITSLCNRGMRFFHAGEVSRALPLVKKTLERVEAKLGPQNPRTLDCMTNLAAVYARAQQPDQARILREKALGRMKKALGPDHPKTITCLNILAILHCEAGSLEQALVLLEEAREILREKFEHNDPDTLKMIGHLARIYWTAKQFDQSVPIFEDILRRQEKTLGREHRDTLQTIANLGVNYKDTGRVEEALPLLFEACEHEATHPSLSWVRSPLVDCYEKTREFRKEKLGVDHPDTVAITTTLVRIYRSMGKMERLLPLLVETFEWKKEKHGADHDQTLRSMNNLAAGYWQAKDLEKSIPLAEELLRLREKKHGREHDDTLMAVIALGVNYRDAGRLEETEVLLEEAFRTAQKDSTVLRSGVTLLEVYDQTGKTGKLASVADEFIVKMRATAYSRDDQLAGWLANVSLELLELEAFRAAEPLLRECLAIRESALPDSWYTFSARSLLGAALLGQKKFAEAEPLLLTGYEGIKQREDTIPPRNKDRPIEALQRLITFYETRAAEGDQDKAARYSAELEAPENAETNPARALEKALRQKPALGQEPKVGRVNIEGNHSTEDRIIRREVKLRPGSVFDAGLLEQSREALMKTGLFKEVRVSHAPARMAGYTDIHILVLEK